MRTAALVTTLATLLIGSNAPAALRCVDLFDRRQAVHGTLKVVGSEAYVQNIGAVATTRAELMLVTTHLNRAVRLFESVSSMPQEIQLRAADENAASGLFGVIYLETKANPSERALPLPAVVVHEFTHIVFYRALRERLSELLGVPGLLLKREKIADEVFEAQAQSEGGAVPAPLRQKQERVLRLVEKRERATKIDTRLDELETLSLEEVFSDFVSAVYMNRSSAMSLAISTSGSNRWNEAKYRDFGKRVSPIGWNKHGDHHLYTPARSYLGEKLHRQLTLAQKQQLVGSVFRALIDELVVLTREKASDVKRTPAELNQRLIDRLKQS